MSTAKKKSTHEPVAREPKAHHAEGVSGYAGSIVVAALGGLFVAYIFNFHGLQTALDAYFSGLDRSTKSHSNVVGKAFVKAMPYLVGAVGAGLLYVLGGAFVRTVEGMLPGKKTKAKAESAPAAVVAVVAAPVAVAQVVATSRPKEGAVWVKPPKPTRPDRGVAKVAPTTIQELVLR